MSKLFVVASKPKKQILLRSNGHLYGVVENNQGHQTKFHTRGSKRARHISQGCTAIITSVVTSQIFGLDSLSSIFACCVFGYLAAATTSPHIGRWQTVENFNIQKTGHDHVELKITAEQEKNLLMELKKKDGRPVFRMIIGSNCVTNLSSLLKKIDVIVERPYAKTPKRALRSIKLT